MKNWLRALLAETLLSVWWILSALSTLATFFFHGWSGKPRLISAISLMVGFAVANFRVFQKQERRISELNHAVASQDVRASQLRISAGDRSRYILRPAGNVPHADFNGAYLEFHLMIENTGRRNSTINSYQVEIVELRRTFPNLQPEEGRNGIQGRHSMHALYPPQILSKTRIIRIGAETATDHGTLLFFIPDVNLDQFVSAGMQMHGPERKFGTLHCRLTLTDTTESSATGDFELQEA